MSYHKIILICNALPEDKEISTATELKMGSIINNVVGMPRAVNSSASVVVMEPREFEEMSQAIQALREHKSVVLNLKLMAPEIALRAVDFVAGAAAAIDGSTKRIGENTFLFTPIRVKVSTPSGVVHEVPLHQSEDN